MPKHVVAFVPLRLTPAGYLHLPGQTIRCHWPGTAEAWLDAAVENGGYRRWQPERDTDGQHREYRAARIFRVFPSTAPGDSLRALEGELLAVWEGP